MTGGTLKIKKLWDYIVDVKKHTCEYSGLW